MISEQEANQQRLLKGAIYIAISVYVCVASVLVARAWINSGRPDEVSQAGIHYEVLGR